MDALVNVASRAAEWSASADRLKSGLVTARWSVFVLLVIGVMTTSTAGQLADADTERSVAVIGAVALALSAFLAARLQSTQRMTAWTRARAACRGAEASGLSSSRPGPPLVTIPPLPRRCSTRSATGSNGMPTIC